MIELTPAVRRRIVLGVAVVAVTYFVLREWTRVGEELPGLGTSLFILGMLAVFGAFAYASKRVVHREAWLLAIPIVILAVDMTLYANPAVLMLGTLGAIGLLVVFIVHLLSDHIRLRSAFWVGVFGPFAFAPLALRGTHAAVIEAIGHRRGERSRIVYGIIAGVVIAIPFLAVFSTVFMEANAAFSGLVDGVLAWTHVYAIDDVSGWIMRAALAVLLGGFVGGLVLFPAKQHRTFNVRVPAVTATTFFVLLNVLFFVFLAFQVPEMFASDAWMRAHNLTYAGLARQSFGELVLASIFALLTVLLWYFVMAQADLRARRVTLSAASVFIACTVVVAISALQRIIRYEAVYGLTLSRMYATVAVVTIIIALVLLGVALWRSRTLAQLLRQLVMLGIVAFTLTMSFPMERVVAAWNVRRELSGFAHRPEFDVTYLLHRSPDAWTPLLAAPHDVLNGFPGPIKTTPMEQMRQHCDNERKWGGWRTYHFFARRSCAAILQQ
ncbi:MAG: DUF4173 domain-containing protein [bacterium]|nr:DUF4173 domain-containing protein [bacterium]